MENRVRRCHCQIQKVWNTRCLYVQYALDQLRTFVDILKPKAEDSLEYDECLGKLAQDVKTGVQSLARVDWRTSVPIHKKMNQAIEDLLWDFCDEHSIDLPMEQMDLIIESIIKTAMSRY